MAMFRILAFLLLAAPFTAQPCPTAASGQPERQPQPQRSGAPYPPISVPPTTIAVPRPLPVPDTTPQPQVVIPRPATVTACDPAGCWDSDGRRLNQIGPQIVGPQGPCNMQGGVVSCR
jgi:hypothetical protein